MTQEIQRPKVGVAVMILKDDKVLLGKRKGSHGAGEFAFPGGHLEYMESFVDCIRREVMEECGIEMKNIRFQCLVNLREYAPKHFVHIQLIADFKKGELKVLEPDKCSSWQFYDLDDLPFPLFETCQLSIENYKLGKSGFVVPEIRG